MAAGYIKMRAAQKSDADNLPSSTNFILVRLSSCTGIFPVREFPAAYIHGMPKVLENVSNNKEEIE
eukprot:scaffold3014_cov116-Cylindrotheca_fusiformis.AAC.4